MTEELLVRVQGCAGRITLRRNSALNALTLPMVQTIRATIRAWQTNHDVKVILIDSSCERAFCAGGDLLSLYERAKHGDLHPARQFWAEEYRLNLEIGNSAKPVVTFMHGFVMGGGIGLGCHAAYRFCDPNTVFAVSQTKIGLIPDAGCTFLLALSPGRMGEYLASTGRRFNAADAVWLGFADAVYPKSQWPELIAELVKTGDPLGLPLSHPTESMLEGALPLVNRVFSGETMGDIWQTLIGTSGIFLSEARTMIDANSPLAMNAAIEMLHRIGEGWPLVQVLELEYRFSHRALKIGDMGEGIRALLVDRDHAPRWQHIAPNLVPMTDTSRMLAPLGAEAWDAHA